VTSVSHPGAVDAVVIGSGPNGLVAANLLADAGWQMQDHDENLVNGALNGGTAGLQQQLVFRPVPGARSSRDADRRAVPGVGISAPWGRRPWGVGRTQHARTRPRADTPPPESWCPTTSATQFHRGRERLMDHGAGARTGALSARRPISAAHERPSVTSTDRW